VNDEDDIEINEERAEELGPINRPEEEASEDGNDAFTLQSLSSGDSQAEGSAEDDEDDEDDEDMEDEEDGSFESTEVVVLNEMIKNEERSWTIVIEGLERLS
jgi:hypothetical protein